MKDNGENKKGISLHANAMSCREMILSEDYWDFIIPPSRNWDNYQVSSDRMCFQQMDFEYRAEYVDSAALEPLTIERYWYNSIPNCYALLDTDALNDAGISAVQNYPTLQLMGEHVMIGFIDTGIDYQNEVFRNVDGSTRIAAIWDQTVQSGTAPEGIEFGSEYTSEDIDTALRSLNPAEIVPSRDENGHGTFLASVAAGSADVEHQFLGAAPEATIAVVKLKEAKKYLKKFYAIREDTLCFQENDIMLGLKYLHRLAEKMEMPLVICIAMGTNFGGHNGTSLLSSMLDSYAQLLNRCVVIGGGNEADQRHHFYHTFNGKRETVTAEIRVGEGVSGFVTELWSTLPNVVTMSITSPSGEQTRQISLRQGYRYNFVFTFERTEVEVEYRLLLENNDSQLIFLRFRNPAPGIWRVHVEPLQMSGGDFHLWLPVREFLDGEVFFLEADPDTTLTEPGTGRNSITVAYYNSRENSVDINSGRGYTRDGRIKPDFAAPGVEITGADPVGRFVTGSSSSAATGIVAGGIALLLEWVAGQPGSRGITTSQVRNLIILGAEQRPQMQFPNKEWGYGTMNLYRSLDTLRRL